MDLIQLIVLIIVIGVLMWLVNAYIPMEPPWKQILNAVVIFAVVLWLLGAFGILPLGHSIHVGSP